ncbi:MAG: PAS domain-containing protein [Legionellaceae bacterium]|nr:PAS domain-containing protein [Legionellaceae bacterium]
MLQHHNVLRFITNANDSHHANYYYKSLNGKYIHANPRTAYIAGVEPDTIVGKMDAELQWAKYGEEYRRSDTKALKNISHISIETGLSLKQQPARVFTFKQVVQDTAGNPTGIFGSTIYIEEISFAELLTALDGMARSLEITTEYLTIPLSKQLCAENKQHAALTPRESQCCHLLCQGMTVKKMAQHLQLSPRTVESYMEQIKDKLQVKRKSELISKLLSENWVDRDCLGGRD